MWIRITFKPKEADITNVLRSVVSIGAPSYEAVTRHPKIPGIPRCIASTRYSDNVFIIVLPTFEIIKNVV